MESCPICKSQLINKKQTLRARSKDENGKPLADLVVYKALCSNCEIYLIKRTQGKKTSDWKTSDVEFTDLDKKISKNELLELKREIHKLENLYDNLERWNEFIQMKKTSDEIFECRPEKFGPKLISRRFVIKRNEYLIGNYSLLIEN